MKTKITKLVILVYMTHWLLTACTPISPSHSTLQPHGVQNSTSQYFSLWWPFRQRDLWDKFRHDSRITDASSIPAVRKHIYQYMRHKDQLRTAIQKSRPYMFYIYQEAQKRQLPVEIALLPIVESNFNPFAYSKAGAAGLWQIMPDTAKQYGVPRNQHFDGRRDVIASTNAALDHLSYLNNYFKGDMLLALAAYDSGRNRVTGAMQKNAQFGYSTNFWSLPLPSETREYVPKLLALATIVNNPERYGVDLPSIKYEPYLTQIEVDKPIALDQVARLADMSASEIYALNPGYNHWRPAPGTGNMQRLILPLDNAEIFKQRLHEKTFNQPIQLVQHEPLAPQKSKQIVNIASNENTLRSIAVGEIMASASSAMQINHTGATSPYSNTQQAQLAQQIIHIANRQSNHFYTATQPQLTANQVTAAQAAAAHGNFHIAVSDHSQIKRHNAIPVTKQLVKATTQNYKIKPGDSLSAISHKHHVKLADLKRWNNLKTLKVLKPGSKLVIKASTA